MTLAVEKDRGIAIVAALWASAILAVIVVSVLQLVRADAKLGRGREDVAELGAIADGAVNITVLALLGPAAAQWPVNGTPVTIPFAGHDVQVSVQDEAGKIDLNTTGEPTPGLFHSSRNHPHPPAASSKPKRPPGRRRDHSSPQAMSA